MMKHTMHTPRILGLLIASLFVGEQSRANPVAANALPTGGTVTSGIGSISSMGSAMSITQSSSSLFTQFDTFNIGAGASVQFIQPGISSIAVSRVLGTDPSQIFGRLSANGQLFLLNPSGIVFGRTAQVNVGGLVASSLKLSDQDILSGKYGFTQGAVGGPVKNMGEIIAREGGLVALVAPKVENTGTIRADLGQVAMVAGDTVRLEIGQGGLIGVNVDGGVAQAQIDNSGAILADGGKVWMTARQAGDLVNSAINQTGVVRANTMADRNGEIWIDGGPQGKLVLDGQTLAMGTGAGQTGGKISATAGDVLVKGKVDASASKGQGYIEIGGGFQGKNAKLRNADTTTLASTADVKANATADGQGGTAIVWSEQRSDVKGSIEAKGAGAGQGGFVETSSKGALNLSATVDVSAANGQSGSWLLDPLTVTISAPPPASTTTAGESIETVDATTISTALNNGANVTVMGQMGININADISKTSGARSSITFTAPGTINLGTVSQARQISASDTPNSGVTSSLDVAFNGGTTGPVNIYGSISTNGGNVVFDKSVNLASARPVSTSVGQPNNTVPASNASGNITFNETVTLSGSNPVTLDTQSVRDGGGNAISTGGNITFNKAVDSLGAGGLPVALTLNTTGQSSGVLNNSGAVVFKGDIGSAMKPLRSLTINGPTTVSLEKATTPQSVYLKNDGGAVLTFSAPGQIRPTLLLNAADTVINVAGFGTSGISDYLQSTFDIVKGTGNTGPANLTISADRSIRILDHDILGSQTGVSTPTNKALNVVLNSNQLGDANSPSTNSGAISLEGQRGANITTYGGTITLAGGTGGTGRAYGVAGQQNTDGISLQNSVLDSSGNGTGTGTGAGGNITLLGSSAVDDATGGTAVHLYGTSGLNSGGSNIVVDGKVTTTSGGAPKDAVLIGSGGTAAVNILASGNGTVTIIGDASAVDPGAQAGASYNGVELSRGANVRTVDGDIVIKGLGGGGNNVNVGENVGVRLKDSDTQVASKTGDITLIGQTGGKTSSYAITASGDDIAIGQRRDQTVNRAPTGDTFTGNVNLVGDTMKFVNNSTNRTRITTQRNGGDLTTGQINIRTLHDNDIQIGGTEATPPSSDNVAMPDKPLYLASELFSGSNAVFIPGAGEINIGQYGDANAPIVGVGETSKTITVAGTTTVRDPLNLLARGGSTGNVVLNSNLTVRGSGVSPGADRTLNIETAAGVTQSSGSSVNAAKVRVDAGGDVLLTGPNLINTIAIQTDGHVGVNNAQALTVGTVSRNLQGSSASTSGITTQESGAATGRYLSVATTGSNADLTITQALSNAGGLVQVSALGETLGMGQNGNAVNQTGSGTITAADLIVRAQDNSDLTLSGNTFNRLAADMSTGQGDLSIVRGSAMASDLTIDTLTLNKAATGANTDTTVAGITSSRAAAETGQIYIQNTNGGVVQSTTGAVNVGGLAVDATSTVNLTASTANRLDKFAAITSDGDIKASSTTSVTVNAVNTQNNASTPANLRNVTGVRAQGSGRDVNLAVTGTGGTLTVANVDNNPDVTINPAVSAADAVTLSTVSGDLTTQGGVTASTGAASISTQTTGNITVGAAVSAGTSATLSTATGNITTNAKISTTNGDIIAQTGTGTGTGTGVVGDITIASELVSASTNPAAPGDIALKATGGTITLGVTTPAGTEGDLTASAGTGDVRMLANSISQHTGSVITASGVSAKAAGTANNSDVSLRGDNTFITLAANTVNGAIQVKNTNAAGTTVGEVVGNMGDVNTLSGLKSSSGQISLLNTQGDVKQNADATGTVLATGSSGGLYIESVAGSVLLDNATNSLGNVAVKATTANKQVALNSSTAVTLSTLSRTDLGNTTATSQAGIATDASTGQVSINSGNGTTTGGIAQNAGAVLTANLAVLQSVGETKLADSGNAINALAAQSTDNFTLANNKALVIGSGTNAANANAVVNGLTTGNAGAMTPVEKQAALQVAGNLTQSQAVQSAELAVVSTGDVTLTQSNSVSRVAVKANNLSLTNTGNLGVSALTTALPDTSVTPTGLLTVSGLDTQTLVLNNTGNLTQSAGTPVKASNGATLNTTGGDATLTSRQNQIVALTGAVDGKADVYTATDLALSNLTAQTDLQVRSAGNMTLQAGQQVTGNGTVVLASDKAFTNQGGPNAVDAGNGRWLIYDSNLTLQDRLGGLSPNFRRFATKYDQYTPGQVLEAGNGYINDAVVVNPNDAIRQNGGVGSGMASGGGQTPTTAMTELQNINAVPVVYAAYQQAPLADIPLPSFPVSRTAFLDNGQVNARFDTPVLVPVYNRTPFSIALAGLVGARQVTKIAMLDGSAPPNWIRYDAENGVVQGRVPVSQNEPFTLVVSTVLADGQPGSLNLFITPSPKPEDEN